MKSKVVAMRFQIACLVMCSGALFAQPPTIESPTTPKPIVVRWSLSDPRCTVVYLDGVAREQFQESGRGVDVWAPRVRDKHTYSVLVGVRNGRKEAVSVDPSNMGGLTDDSPHIVMQSIDGDAKITKENRSAHRWAMLGAGLSGYAAGSTSNTTATARSSDGSTATVTTHDDSGVLQVEKDAANNKGVIDAGSSMEASALLCRNTVSKGERALGRVYIERPKGMAKKAQLAEFVVDLGDTIYVFPYANGGIPK